MQTASVLECNNERLSKKQFLALVDHDVTRKTMYVTLQTRLLYATIRFSANSFDAQYKMFQRFHITTVVDDRSRAKISSVLLEYTEYPCKRNIDVVRISYL